MNKFSLSKLSNGLPLIYVPLAAAPSATILFMVRTGSKYESRQLSGLSHFLEHMFFKGTEKRPRTIDIAGELDALGAVFNAFTSKEYTGYYIKVDKKKINTAADVLSDMLLGSLFDTKEIDRERGVIIEEINMYADNPLIHIEDVFENCLYGDTPAGRDTAGTTKTVKSFKREDFVKYFQSQYVAGNTSLIVAGDLKLAQVKALAEKYFSKISKRRAQGKEAVHEKQQKPAFEFSYKKTDQAHLALGVRTFPDGHRDELIAKLIAIILGGSMSSRLFTELRERRGLAYSVHTSSEFYTDSGYLLTKAGVPLNRLEESVDVILEEYKKLTKEEVPKAELRRNLDLIKGKLAIQMEGSDDVANWYAQETIFKKKPGTPAEFLAKLKRITPADIKRVAKDIFKNKGLNLAVIGDIKNTSSIKRRLHF